jgi:hypothetical protein
VTVDGDTVAVLLKRLASCRRRNKDLSTKVVQLTQSRDAWKRKAMIRSHEENLRRRRERRRRKLHPEMEYGSDVVQRILAIPPRDIK